MRQSSMFFAFAGILLVASASILARGGPPLKAAMAAGIAVAMIVVGRNSRRAGN